jgi:hypothetical protein
MTQRWGHRQRACAHVCVLCESGLALVKHAAAGVDIAAAVAADVVVPLLPPSS